ncbi:MAG: hypothetical protein Kow00117_13410 [Phototrophicales bacterium]
MMDPQTLITLLTMDNLHDVTSLALSLFINLIKPLAACLLIWDDEMGRYIVGHTYAGDNLIPAQVRRKLLKLANNAYHQGTQFPRYLDADVFYQPLNNEHGHVGAYLCEGGACQPNQHDASYQQLLHVVARALYVNGTLSQVQREHQELVAERERLEGLLLAVAQQQQTIDRLLARERQLSASLEAKVEERTAELREAQKWLIQSEKLAVIGKLASSLAHEINNPLQAIQSGLGLILSDLDQLNIDHMKGDLLVIQRELERISGLFHQMLDFYRPASYVFEPLVINAICHDIQVLMRKRLQEANVTLLLELTEDLPMTCGDGNQIKQVLLNLILNAVDAMLPHGGQIVLQTSTRKNEVWISVKDNGPGISTENQKQLFEPLFTTKTRGLGLGLSISQQIAQRHDGKILVESVLGKGTTFTLVLPSQERCYDKTFSCG